MEKGSGAGLRGPARSSKEASGPERFGLVRFRSGGFRPAGFGQDLSCAGRINAASSQPARKGGRCRQGVPGRALRCSSPVPSPSRRSVLSRVAGVPQAGRCRPAAAGSFLPEGRRRSCLQPGQAAARHEAAWLPSVGRRRLRGGLPSSPLPCRYRQPVRRVRTEAQAALPGAVRFSAAAVGRGTGGRGSVRCRIGTWRVCPAACAGSAPVASAEPRPSEARRRGVAWPAGWIA